MLLGKKTIGTIAYMGGTMAIPEPFSWAWSQMIQFNNDYLVSPGERIEYIHATVSYHAFARDTLAEHIRGDWILMLDTDVIFEPDICARMLYRLEKYKIDVLAGIYPYKGNPHAPVLYGYNSKTRKKYVIGDWPKNIDLIQLHSAGAGCLMIRRSVLDRIYAKGESPFAIIPPYSEDNSFFERLYKLKIKAYYSPNITVEHLAYKNLNLKDDYNPKENVIKRQTDVGGFK